MNSRSRCNNHEAMAAVRILITGVHAFGGMMASLLAAALLLASPQSGRAVETLEGFESTTVFSGLSQPSAVRFAPDGRVFIAEKSGIIKIFDDTGDAEPDVLEDVLTENVHDVWDRGLLGLAIAPGFPADPFVYVLYTWDLAGWGDECPDPPGILGDGCVVNGRLSRLEIAADNTLIGGEQVLLEGAWCQQFPSHSIGDLVFGEDGMLYLSAGDGASFIFADYGQAGGSPGSPVPSNPCDDPPGGPNIAPPSAEGGALRSQDVLTQDDPTSHDGTVLRIDVSTVPVSAPPDNPLTGNEVPDDDFIIAHGLRNPFRMAVRPGTAELWVGDVGWNTWEEVNRITDPTDATVENFGWPCYEGRYDDGAGGSSRVAPEYEGLGLDLCELLYANGDAPLGVGAESILTAPFYAYSHFEKVVPGEACGVGSSSPSGLAFYPGGRFPNRYDDALFFQDSSRRCIWSIRAGAGGLPDPETRASFLWDASAEPVDLQVGPAGDLYYVTFNDGKVHRIEFPRELSLAVSGACPGELSIDIAGASPEASVGIAFSTEAGEQTLPGGSCAGTTIGLESPRLAGTIPTDGNGNAQLSVTAPAEACGNLLQAIDPATCATSEVVALPAR